MAAIVDEYWAEVCDAVVSIEALSEDPEFPQHELAALVASKVFFHVEEYADALRLALAAGAQFNVDGKTEYVETMICMYLGGGDDDRTSRRPLTHCFLSPCSLFHSQMH